MGAAVAGATSASATVLRAAPRPATIEWRTVVNDADPIPGSARNFNSYNQPSVNADGFVVFRARGKGPGEPPHGIFTRDMSYDDSPIVTIADRDSRVPAPNNQDTTFIEFPSFPRIDRDAARFAFRGNSDPVWQDPLEPESEPVGTTGVFANPGGVLVTAASKLGAVPGFERFAVPGAGAGTFFDVFPGAPAVTDGTTIVFKGNYTESGVARTGDYYRVLASAYTGGSAAVQLLANSDSTLIPGTEQVFGSVAPPSAADGTAVFAGFDDEDAPSLGGIYLAPLTPQPDLEPLVEIGGPVTDWKGTETGETFNRLGEGLSYDGRFVGFWGAWGEETRGVTVHCPTEGNALRRAFCRSECPEPAGCTFQVPVHQGIFVHDLANGRTWRAAVTGDDGYRDFLFWNFSGKVPGQEGEDEGEPARWRAASFVAVDAREGGAFRVAWKAERSDSTVGIYLGFGPGDLLRHALPLVDTTMDGATLDAQAEGLPITEMGLERDGFRGGHLAISARMGSEETGWAGIYLTDVGGPEAGAGAGK